MESRMVRRLVIMGVAVALVMAVALPADAGGVPAVTSKVTDFYTNALDAEGDFRSVHCSHAHQVIKGDKVFETYRCEFVSDAFWGDPVLPTRAMRWDYESSQDAGPDATIPSISGPYRWFSDIEDLTSSDLCWWYTNDWRTVITPSGNVNVRVVYDPPVIEGPDCP